MCVEFRVGRTDHRVVEDFLSEQPSGVGAIVLEAANLSFQGVIAEAASAAHVEVLVDPLTERLVIEGYSPKGLDYADKYPLDLARLRRMPAQAELMERVLAVQIDCATMLVPPHFYAESIDVLELDVALAGLTAQAARSAKKPVRAVLAARRELLAEQQVSDRIAREYRRAGIESIELRLSPLGGEEDGARKVASALAIVDAFRAAELKVTLGLQGNLGQTALALGLVDSYSVGVGIREHFNFSSSMSQQRRAKSGGKRPFGRSAGVFLPIAGVTVQRAVARELYSDKTIRSRLACTLGRCATNIDGPVNDPRGHYLHARAALVESTLGYPERWRATQERDRLERAIDFRETLNKNYLAPPQELKTRTIRALASEIDRRIEQAKTA